jgi:biotin carboxylase
MQTLLFVSGGIEALPGIRLARERGLHTVVSDGSAEAPGFEVAHDGFVADTYGVAETVLAARQYHETVRPIDGVISVGADVPVTVAAVAEDLELPGISGESAYLAADKLAMKRRFLQRGVAIPWFSAVQSIAHLRQIVGQRRLPMVLKPVDSRGARGVLLLTEQVDLDWAFALSSGQSPTARVMVEDYLEGPQVSTESIVLSGTCQTVGFSDRNYDLLERFAPYMIEDGGQMPSIHPAPIRTEVEALVGRAAAALGILEGVVKGDIVISRGRAFVIEIAARLSGGYFCTHQIPLNTGVDFVGRAIDLALGVPVHAEDLQPRLNVGVAQRYIFPEPGLVERVEVPDLRPGVEMLEIRVKPGDVIGPIVGHPSRAGVVIGTGNTREEAVALAEQVVRSVAVETR